MENTYQDLITDIQSKNPKISGKLEGGKKFKIKSDFKPAGDQPDAIKKLVRGANKEEFQTTKFATLIHLLKQTTGKTVEQKVGQQLVGQRIIQ